MNIVNSLRRELGSCLTEQDNLELKQAKGIYKKFLEVQKVFSMLKVLPQYKYFTRPIYKIVASKSNAVIATGASFFITDLVIHQFFQGTVLRCALTLGQRCSLSYDPYTAAFWMAMSIPVMAVKYNHLVKGRS